MLTGIKTYTVEFGRDGAPEMAYIVGTLLSGGHRFVANHADESTLQRLASAHEECIGKQGQVSPKRIASGEPESNVFSLDPKATL